MLLHDSTKPHTHCTHVLTVRSRSLHESHVRLGCKQFTSGMRLNGSNKTNPKSIKAISGSTKDTNSGICITDIRRSERKLVRGGFIHFVHLYGYDRCRLHPIQSIQQTKQVTLSLIGSCSACRCSVDIHTINDEHYAT